MSWSRTYDGAEPVRVNKWLAQSGVCSRREADELIAAGAVLIDGARVSDAGRKIAAGQTLVLNDRAELGLEAQISVMIHKPVGVVSAQPDPGQTPAARLLTSERQAGSGSVPSSRASLPPLGRLDQDSRGLLLLSEDGVLAKAFQRARDVRFCVLSFTSDWLYPTAESRHVVRALNAAGARASFVEIESDKGHDAFLLDEPVMTAALAGFLSAAAHARGLA